MRAADHAGRRPGEEQPHRAQPRRRRDPATPPRDCMTCSGAATPLRRQARFEIGEIAVDHRLHVGVEGGDDGALVLAERRIDLRGERHEQVGMARQRRCSRARRSCASLRNENRKHDGDRPRTRRRPARRRPRCNGSPRRAACSTSPGRRRCAPATSLRMRPGARNTGVSGSSVRSYIWWRICRPISSTSRKPSVVMRPTRAPLRSSTALVATVVPCTKRATSLRRRCPRPACMRSSGFEHRDGSDRPGWSGS